MNESYSIYGWVLASGFLAVPILCIGFGLVRRAKSLLGIGIGIACVYLLAAFAYVFMVGPDRSGIVTHGTSPEGREYCIVQTYKGLGEPYQVSFYIRDAAGIWRWNYLAHQDFVWHSATVAFSDGVAHIAREGRPFRDVPVPTDTVDLAKVQAGNRDDYCPSNFTPEDILSFHNKMFKE